ERKDQYSDIENTEQRAGDLDEQQRSPAVSLLEPQLLIGKVQRSPRHQRPEKRRGNGKRQNKRNNILRQKAVELTMNPRADKVQTDVEKRDKHQPVADEDSPIGFPHRFPAAFRLNVLCADGI